MKSLFITREQAKVLSDDLHEYAYMKDSSDRPLFIGFKITFADSLSSNTMPGSVLEMHPIPHNTEIGVREE